MSLDLIIAFGITFILCYCFVRFAPLMNFMAEPGEHRRHAKPIPIGGGVAMMLGLSAVTLCFLPEQPYLSLLVCLALITTMGALDDLFNLPSWSRFIIQGVVAFLMLHWTGTQLETLGGLVSSNTVTLNRWSLPLSIFAIIGVINAINMSDGMDGLAASLSLIVLGFLLVLGSSDRQFISISIAVVLGFLSLNTRLGRRRAKLFMGDAGSTMLGLLLAYLLIKNTQTPNQVMPPVTALWLLALPLIDTVSLLLLRALRGRSPFAADRNHYHHILQRAGLSVNQTLLLVVSLQIILATVGVLMLRFGIQQHYQFYLFLSLFFCYFLSLAFVSRKNK